MDIQMPVNHKYDASYTSPYPKSNKSNSQHSQKTQNLINIDMVFRE
jgi:hypothetical protein